MNITIRRSEPTDLDLLLKLEQKAFPYFQQSSRRTLDLSLKSSFQQVWIAEDSSKEIPETVGSLVLYLYKKTIRIFSIVVDPDLQGQGIGRTLLEKAQDIAELNGAVRVSLEADAENRKLINWYKKVGFEATELLTDYYEVGRDGMRMVKYLPEKTYKSRITNIVVVDNPKKWKLEVENVEVVSSKEYTSNKDHYSERPLRVFNLCNSYKYQSIGYYVSLLASAREHRAIPNVATIRDFNDVGTIRSIADDIEEVIQKALNKVKEDELVLNVYFGQTINPAYKTLGQKLYQLFEAPVFQVEFIRNGHWDIKKIVPLSLNKINSEEIESVQGFAANYFRSKRFKRTKFKNYTYYLAILVNPDEANPPSDAKALKKFEKAAEELNIYTEFITKEDYNRLSEFDALFIRETTNVNNHTYQFSRKAYAEGLVVIDDPWSILRCSNKIYLHERLRMSNIKTPETEILYKHSQKGTGSENKKYPLILKQPDGAFSLGVTKVNDEQELEKSLERLFKKSDLVIAQEFMPSDYDWRIGVLDNQPLFACKYFMAKGHWQIYNWGNSTEEQAGKSITVPIEEVPPHVLKKALKAASLMGDGLYGVDLKVKDEKSYVIEVNDNPNIDSGIEDWVAGMELYRKVIKSFISRIEMSRNIARFVSVEPD